MAQKLQSVDHNMQGILQDYQSGDEAPLPVRMKNVEDSLNKNAQMFRYF